MKTLKYIIIILVTFTSCDTLLDEPMYDFRSREDVFTNESGFRGLLGGMYKNNTSVYTNHIHQMLGFHSGVLMRRTGGDEFWAQMAGNSSRWSENVYRSLYVTIGSANTLIDQEELIGEDNLELLQYIGEAYFMRAVSYFYLVRMYGPVPLSTEPVIVLSDSYKPRPNSVDEVYELIITDLKKAHSFLPDVQEEVGKPKRLAAYALMSKVYLTWAGVEDTDEYWKLAMDYADSVIVTSDGDLEPYSAPDEGYALENDFADIFSIDNEFNSESIFEVNYLPIENQGQKYTKYYMAQSAPWIMGNGSGRLMLAREVYDTIVATHGGSDYRLKNGVVVAYVKDGKTDTTLLYGHDSASANALLPYCQKWEDPTASGSDAGNNFIFLRFADMFLTYAEAANEYNNGPTSMAIDRLNIILQRSRSQGDTIPKDVEVTDFNVTGKTTEQAFRDRIMVERYVEFVGELHDWFDVRRRDVDYLKSVFENHNKRLERLEAEGGSILPKTDFVFPLEDDLVLKNMLLPLSNEEIDANPLIDYSDQNPGY